MKKTSAWIVGTCSFAVPALAVAHISVSGQGFAGTTQEITFGVGHGCSTNENPSIDTYRVRVEIPAGVTSVRPLPSEFGKVTIEKSPQTGLVSAVVWQKADADVLESDTNYYKLALRIGVPKDKPFTKLLFPTHQVCRKKGETDPTKDITVDWIGASEPAPDSGAPEPAPALTIVPPHVAGWNKFKVPVDVTDLKTYFGDALIVWKGNAAYSANPATVDQIKTTADATVLSSLQANDEVWVKY